MPKKHFFENIKLIVLLGYIVLFALSIFGIIKINQELVRFSQKESPKTESKKLRLVSNTLLSLYEMESLRKILFTEQSSTTTLQEAYENIREKLNQQIDSLYKLSNDKQLQINLDTVKTLLGKKENNLNSMLRLMDSINNLPYSNILSKTVLSTKSVDDLSRMITESTRNKKDTTLYVEKKRNFFERVKNVFSDRPDSIKVVSKTDTTKIDTSYIEPPKTITDTIVQYINKINAKSNRRKINYLTKLSKRQTDMLYYDELLTEQINTILRRIEENEKQQAQQTTQQKRVLLQKSSSTVYWIALIALLVLVVFIALSLAQINKSLRYKNDLEKSNQYAEFLARSREKLLLMISHDIKAPLSSIIGHTELLTHQSILQKEKESIDSIRTSSEQILDLSNKLLEYHKLEQGKSEIRQVVFMAHQLLADIYHTFLPLASQKKLTLIQNNKIPQQQFYRGDPYILKQILNNLISNAIKFTKKGQIQIDARIEDEKLLVAVMDTGVGIDEKDQKHLFEQFKRMGTLQAQRSIEGHGLGLSITIKLVQLIGGKIELNSELGKGTKFLITIPLPIAEQPNLPQHSAEPIVAKSIRGKKVLFVDDDITMLNVYAKVIEKEGAKVTTCSDSTAVIEILQKNRYDIVFTDIQMPQLNGVELVKKIRNLKGGYQKLPVVALSARSTMSVEHLRDIGFTNFANKPVNLQQLMMLIAQSDEPISSLASSIDEESEGNSEGMDALIEFVKDDREMAQEIVQTFYSENKHKLQQLRKAQDKNDIENIQIIAHKLLPVMKMIQADELVMLLLQIEQGQIEEKQTARLIQLLEQQNKETEKYIRQHFS